MKKYLLVMSFLFVFLLSGCGKDKTNGREQLDFSKPAELTGRLSEIMSTHPDLWDKSRKLRPKPVIFLAQPVDFLVIPKKVVGGYRDVLNVTKVQIIHNTNRGRDEEAKKQIDLKKAELAAKLAALKNKEVTVSCTYFNHAEAKSDTTEVICVLGDIKLN